MASPRNFWQRILMSTRWSGWKISSRHRLDPELIRGSLNYRNSALSYRNLRVLLWTVVILLSLSGCSWVKSLISGGKEPGKTKIAQEVDQTILPAGTLRKITPYTGYLIDAYSMIDKHMKAEDLEIIPRLMQRYGVRKTILGRKHQYTQQRLVQLSAQYPRQIIPALKVTNRYYKNDNPLYADALEKSLNEYKYSALGDLQVYRPPGANDLEHLVVDLDDERVGKVVQIAKRMQWPVLFQLQFSRMGEEEFEWYMETLDELAQDNREAAFIFLHMGTLKIDQIKRLIKKHPNIYFELSRTNPEYEDDKGVYKMIVNYIEVDPKWKVLLNQYSDRFLVGYHNFGLIDWHEKPYQTQTRWIRYILGNLEPVAADRIAHGNAERLWRLQ